MNNENHELSTNRRAPGRRRRQPARARAAAYFLNVVVVYQDQAARRGAQRVCARAARLVGPRHLRAQWWDIQALTRPAALTDAVSATMRSDVIVVAVREGESLPLGFYLWADLWLPYGPRHSGALVALVGAPRRPCAEPGRSRQFLKALAQRAGLELFVQERRARQVVAVTGPRPRRGSGGARAQSPPELAMRVRVERVLDGPSASGAQAGPLLSVRVEPAAGARTAQLPLRYADRLRCWNGWRLEFERGQSER